MKLIDKLLLAAIAIAVIVVYVVGVAQGTEGHTLTVDGVTYTPSKVVGNGPTVHYYTPGATPSVAYTERHTWDGNGSDNLPCEGRLHWIDNANVLTISHCESTDGTTTTTTTYAGTTSTSSPQVTTTTAQATTTTVSRTTSTTKGDSTTTTSKGNASTTTTPTTSTICTGSDDPTLPCGGVAGGGGVCAVAVMEGAATCNLHNRMDGVLWFLLVAHVLGFGLLALASAWVIGRRR